ncbi:hypothetical protein I317_01508 [Kwoniella heveanensis CBS 569]|uniref:Uncharacterized protein n=1 Tax=Kwoniella heveanensis BCC8398 TaxID=1296120 RepID=A0A1B9H4C6_9TREE|nr:hypothetical protein I316_00348 [Kwoniella heveanensis BCC8398]OCF44621.1 hypothetical protein I317_01508 [Kwoniella heveanensis CBS 569]
MPNNDSTTRGTELSDLPSWGELSDAAYARSVSLQQTEEALEEQRTRINGLETAITQAQAGQLSTSASKAYKSQLGEAKEKLSRLEQTRATLADQVASDSQTFGESSFG